jgi:hypothetical protein
MTNTSSLAVAANIFTSPNEAFAVLKATPRAWLPILVLIVGSTWISFTYIYAVDLGWLIETQLQMGGGAALTDAQREEAVTASLRLSPTVYGAIGAVSSSVIVLLVLFLTALYYTGVSFVTHDGVKLKQWFALACWCTLPMVFGMLAQLVNLTVNDARFMPQDALNPLSFGNLLSIDRAGATILQRILLGIDITAIWGLVLSVLGYQSWTGSSMVKAVAIVLGPLAAIVTISTVLTLT